MTDLRRYLNCIEQKTYRGQKLNYELGYRKFKRQNFAISSLQKFETNLRKFTERVLGKKYKFSPIYLFCKEYQKVEETYFCSELLAQCLDECGVFSFSQPAYKILPSKLINIQRISGPVAQLMINARLIVLLRITIQNQHIFMDQLRMSGQRNDTYTI